MSRVMAWLVKSLLDHILTLVTMTQNLLARLVLRISAHIVPKKKLELKTKHFQIS